MGAEQRVATRPPGGVPALGVVVGGSSGIEVNFTCKLTLLPPTEPEATPNNAVAADTTQYVY